MPNPPDSLDSLDTQRLVRWLWAVCLLGVTHGSLYPWQFYGSASVARGWHRLWHQASWWTSNGDVLGNVLLFVPLGALSVLLLQRMKGRPVLRVALVLLGGLLFAFLLQVLQIWLPKRSPAFSDVVWNAVGLFLGLLLAEPTRQPLAALQRLWRTPYREGLAMAMLWLAIAWWPLLPALSRGLVRQTLRDLDQVAQVSWTPALAFAAGAALVLHLVRDAPWRAAMVLALPILGVLGRFVFEHPLPWASHVLGWLLGSVAGALSWRWTAPRAERGLILAVIAVWLVTALWPWQWSSTPQDLQVIPFVASLSSERVVNSLALLWDLFWVAAVLILARHKRWPLSRVALALSALLLFREVLHCWMPLQRADITPVLLPWLCWALMRKRPQPAPTAAPVVGPPDDQNRG